VKDLTTLGPIADEIGTLIDEALEDPSRAEIVKARIRQRLERRIGPLTGSEEEQGESDDEQGDEDLWDNLPV
jgi:hypothetical protein